MARRPGKRLGFAPDLYKTRNPFVKIDYRTNEGFLVKATRKTLLEQLAHEPNPAEGMLVERLCMINLRLHQMDQQLLDGTFDAKDGALFSAFANALTRGLVQLGLLRGTARVGGRPHRRLTNLPDIL